MLSAVRHCKFYKLTEQYFQLLIYLFQFEAPVILDWNVVESI